MTIPSGTNYVPIEPRLYWPGGIPTSVRFQPESEIPEDQLKEECKAWLCFVSENWITPEAAGVTGDFSDYESRQRRDLIVQWAEAEQSFRDSYHDRAPAPSPRLAVPKNPNETLQNCDHLPIYSVIVLPKVDKTNPVNHAHWIKLLLLLNRFDGVHDNHLVYDDPVHCLILAGDSACSQSVRPPANKEETGPWIFLENADFDQICMTRHGMVAYTGMGYFFMIDQTNLDEGTISAVNFGHDGKIQNEIRFRPFWIDMVLYTLGESTSVKTLQGSYYDMETTPNAGLHLDMNAPVLAILETARVGRPDGFRSSRLEEDVEHYAPGYLTLEAQGREAEYDEAPLIEALFAEL